jgi:hypothetical protein
MKSDIRGIIILVCVFIIASFALAAGCGGSESSSSTQAGSEEDDGNPAVVEEGGGQTGTAQPGEKTIQMCGRSVLGGWFSHWGWDGDPADPASFAGYRVIYHEMESPPAITDTALGVVRQMKQQGDNLMFFKLCFVDFIGGDEASARENLQANEAIVQAVANAAVQGNGMTLIIGNALPTVREYTDYWLVWNHRQYNDFLETLSSQYPGRFFILDLYGSLAAPEGWLNPAYASYPDDSHPNEAGYDAMDEALRAVLARLASSP